MLLISLSGPLIATAIVVLFFKFFISPKYGKTRHENKRHKFLFFAWIVALVFVWNGVSGIFNEAFVTAFAGLPVSAKALQIAVFGLVFWPLLVAAVTWLLIKAFVKER